MASGCINRIGARIHSLAVTARIRKERLQLHLMLNAYWEPLEFELPPVGEGPQGHWRQGLDTALESPDDIYAWAQAPVLEGTTYVVQPRSVVLLVARAPREADPDARESGGPGAAQG